MIASLLLLAAPAPQCPAVTLAVSGSKTFVKAYAPGSPAFRKTSANFAEAYAKACAQGLLKKKPLAPSGPSTAFGGPPPRSGEELR